MADFGKIRQQGEQAHAAGDTANPYNPKSSSFAAWQAGWNADAEAEASAARNDPSTGAAPMTDTATIKAELRAQNAPRVIDLTPTWADLMPAFFAILENGTDTGKDLARAELTRLARMADANNAREKEQLAAAKASEQQER